jgi:REP element-mobilizing transposase RayT
MKKFAGKYRIDTARAQWWNYENEGLYFLTLCVENQECCFGEVQSSQGLIEMYCNDLGQIAQRCWEEIPLHFSNVLLDAYIIMPNHVHGILQLTAPRTDAIYRVSKSGAIYRVSKSDAIYRVSKSGAMNRASTNDAINRSDTSDAINRVSTAAITNDKRNCIGSGGITGDHNPMLHNNVSRIIRWYKGRVAYECRKIYPTFAWHTRFYDIIIRDEPSYQNMANYIHDNPARWYQDKFHPQNKESGK